MRVKLEEKQRFFSGRVSGLKEGQIIDLYRASKDLKKDFQVHYNPEENLKRLIIKPTPLLSIFVYPKGNVQIICRNHGEFNVKLVRSCLKRVIFES